jgi:hypothetical protein
LFSTSANGRIEHWDVALQAWRDAPWLGQGAGTYAHDWALRRPLEFAVVEGHSLYLEMLGELGVAGLALLATALLAPLVALMRRRREDRVLWSAVLAVAVAWMVRAALDWDWEMPVLTLPVLALLGAACARDIARGEAPGAVAGAAQARRGRRSGTTRLVAGLAILILALTPWRVSESQRHLDAALAALHGGDCNTAIDRALAAADVANMRPEPFELAGYCDVRIGRAQLGERMLESAVRRDPRSWELHYGLALVRAAAGGDPRPQLRTADRLNPKEPVVDDAIAAFARIGPRRWRETAGTLPIVVPPPAGRSAASSSGTPPK